MIQGVYAIHNTVNDKIYVGSSRNIQKRFSTHKRQLRDDIHHSRYLQRAMIYMIINQKRWGDTQS